ncbi:MAG: hypothetical protein RL481_1005 [Pseudomonadota bacterium]|jgi:uncharacterized protein
MTDTSPFARHISLDAMRGFAVMGILAMNIIGFAMPEWAYVSPGVYGGETLADQISWFFNFVFVDGKMRGLFSLLFGASMMLIIARAEAKGQNSAKVHYARMFWLAMFGLAHFFFLWFGDILFLYACVGSLAFLMHHWEVRKLIKWALIVYGLGFLLWAAQFGSLQFLQWAALQPGADPDIVSNYRAVMASDDFNVNIAAELALHRGGWSGIFADKLSEWWAPLIAVAQGITETLPLMMLGMAMQKSGFITGEWAVADYRRWVWRLLPAGLLLSAIIAVVVWSTSFNLIHMLAAFLAWTAIPRLMVTIGYAALLLILIQRLAGSAFLLRVAAAGRAAFTNYLGTTIVMTTIFYGYGLGLFGYVNRPALWLFVFGAWAIMLLWSKPWLERYHYGPLEWLWRSLTQMKLQPLRR